MAKVEIYTTPICGFCARAKALLDQKGVAYDEIDVWTVPGAKSAMVARAGGAMTVPQIFIDGAHLGGSDDLAKAEAEGRLDALLAG